MVWPLPSKTAVKGFGTGADRRPASAAVTEGVARVDKTARVGIEVQGPLEFVPQAVAGAD